MTANELPGDPFTYAASGFDTTFRRYFTESDVQQTEDYWKVTTELANPIANMIIVRDPSNQELILTLANERSTASFPTALVMLGMPDPSLNRQLANLGFIDTEIAHAMAANLTTLDSELDDSSFELRELTTDDHDLWVDTMSIGYELPRDFVTRIGPASAAPMDDSSDDEYRYFVAFSKGNPVASATLIIRNGIVEVYNISTRPEFRGIGAGTFVTKAPLLRCANEGYTTAILQASALGRSIYERIGFESLGTFLFFFHSGN